MRISIGGLFQALLGKRVNVVSARSVNGFVEEANDDDIVSWISSSLAGQQTSGNPMTLDASTKVVTLKIRVRQEDIRTLFKTLGKPQVRIHEAWVGDKEVEDAAELLKSDNKLDILF